MVVIGPLREARDGGLHALQPVHTCNYPDTLNFCFRSVYFLFAPLWAALLWFGAAAVQRARTRDRTAVCEYM